MRHKAPGCGIEESRALFQCPSLKNGKLSLWIARGNELGQKSADQDWAILAGHPKSPGIDPHVSSFLFPSLCLEYLSLNRDAVEADACGLFFLCQINSAIIGKVHVHK
jgi:hypothetical protein